MTLSFKEPIVKQTTVTVQNVMIGNRQLTQRVFKQIIEEDIFGEEPNSLKGEAWGFVNYFVESRMNVWKISFNRYKHILWVKNGQLRRCYVHKNYLENDDGTKRYWTDNIHEYAAIYLLKLPQLFIAV